MGENIKGIILGNLEINKLISKQAFNKSIQVLSNVLNFK
jgi:hypothetical protein